MARSRAELTKFDLALIAPGWKVFVGVPESIMIQTKLRENGKPTHDDAAAVIALCQCVIWHGP